MRIILTTCLLAVLAITGSVYAQGEYSYSMDLKIGSGNVNNIDTLYNQVIYFNKSSNNLKHVSNGGRVESINGYDIVFKDANGHVLPSYQELYDPSSGRLVYFVRLPIIYPGVDNYFYVHFGNDQITSSTDDLTCFSDFTYVLAKHDIGSTYQSEQVLSSTTFTQTNSSLVGVNDTRFNNTEIYKMSSGDYVESSSMIQMAGDFSLILWAKGKSSNYQAQQGIIGKDLPGLEDQSFYLGTKGQKFEFGYGDGTTFYSTVAGQNFLGSSWKNVVLTREGDRIYLYSNGSLLDSLVNVNMPDTLEFNRIGAIATDFSEFSLDDMYLRDYAMNEDQVAFEYRFKSGLSAIVSTISNFSTNVYESVADGSSQTGATWKHGSALPGTTNKVVINDSVYFNANKTISILRIAPGGKVDLNNTMTVTDSLIIEGELHVRNAKSFILGSNCVVSTSDSVTICRETGVLLDDAIYQYWSSPVTGAVIGEVMTGTNPSDFYSWDGTTQNWSLESSTAIMQRGKGYTATSIIGIANQNVTRCFTGALNHGTIQVNVKSGNNFLGNPYACGLDNEAFVDYNTGILGTLYLWNQKSSYGNSGDYATWTKLGTTPGNSGRNPQDFMPTAQGFFVEASADGTVEFNNSMMTANSNQTFFKSDTVEAENTWFKVEDLLDSTAWQINLIGFHPEATDSVDRLYDGKMFTTNYVLNLYCDLEGVKYAINGLNSWGSESEKNVPIDIYSSSDRTVKFTLDSFSLDTSVYYVGLLDLQTNMRYDLRKEIAFLDVFTGVTSNRFEIEYKRLNHPDLAPGLGDGNDELTHVGEVNILHSIRNFGNRVELVSTERIEFVRVLSIDGRIVDSFAVNNNQFVWEKQGRSNILLFELTYPTGKRIEKVVLH